MRNQTQNTRNNKVSFIRIGKEREASDLPIQCFESLYPKSKSEHSKQFQKRFVIREKLGGEEIEV